MSEVKSPCIHFCVVRNGVCGGCGRTNDEIMDWMILNDEERLKVVENAKNRLENKNLDETANKNENNKT